MFSFRFIQKDQYYEISFSKQLIVGFILNSKLKLVTNIVDHFLIIYIYSLNSLFRFLLFKSNIMSY